METFETIGKDEWTYNLLKYETSNTYLKPLNKREYFGKHTLEKRDVDFPSGMTSSSVPKEASLSTIAPCYTRLQVINPGPRCAKTTFNGVSKCFTCKPFWNNFGKNNFFYKQGYFHNSSVLFTSWDMWRNKDFACICSTLLLLLYGLARITSHSSDTQGPESRGKMTSSWKFIIFRNTFNELPNQLEDIFNFHGKINPFFQIFHCVP